MTANVVSVNSFMGDLPELLVVDKPKGITSFGVVARVRRILKDAGHGRVKVGHAGTLDPLASGVMVLGIGTGTKKLTTLIKLDKTYDAEIILGEQRITGDLEGDVLDEIDVPLTNALEEKIHMSVESMIGTLQLPVPAFSAIKQGGQPLYKKARNGQRVDVPEKYMTIHGAQITNVQSVGNRVHVCVTFDVASGTYIRSLAEELGKRLGLPATLGNLRRTRVGTYTLEGAPTVLV